PPRAAPTLASAEATASAGEWGTAAGAMRSGDLPGAERAFGDLARSSDPRTRDEARLARAQVLVAEGRTGEARSELAVLAPSGATPLVRERATEALRTLSERQPASANSGN